MERVFKRWARGVLFGALTGIAVWSGAEPVAAQYERSCHFVVEVTPSEAGLRDQIYSFRVFGITRSRTAANQLRRDIRADGTTCVQTHWANRDAASRPPECEGTRFRQYPFDSMYTQIREDICDANRAETRLTADIELFIRGHRGCLERDEERGVVDPAAYVMIAPNVRINCPIREGGGSEMGGPAPLENTRLPGHDLPGGRSNGLASWRECREQCVFADGCGAWTFRPAGVWGESQSVCLLKSRAASQVEDSCCTSGINN